MAVGRTLDGRAYPGGMWARRLLPGGLLWVLLRALLASPPVEVAALQNGVGHMPAMGWNSWNFFRCNIDEKTIREVADAIVSSGLAAAGYKYVNVDDCWMHHRDADGTVLPDPAKFPSGMKALGDYIHGLGLKFGIYTSPGNATCEGYIGSWGHEQQDANTYAAWGVDYVKGLAAGGGRAGNGGGGGGGAWAQYDFCSMQDERGRVFEEPEKAFARMRDALNATGRQVVYSISNWGGSAPWRWGPKVAHSWRTGIDLFAVWDDAGAKQLVLPNFLQSVMSVVRNQVCLRSPAC